MKKLVMLLGISLLPLAVVMLNRASMPAHSIQNDDIQVVKDATNIINDFSSGIVVPIQAQGNAYETIAISSTIVICLDGDIGANGKCINGNDPLNATLNILTAKGECKENFKDCLKTIHKWDSILELSTNEKKLFILYPDGTFKKDASFSIDQSALAFYQTVAQLLKDIGLKNDRP